MSAVVLVANAVTFVWAMRLFYRCWRAWPEMRRLRAETEYLIRAWQEMKP